MSFERIKQLRTEGEPLYIKNNTKSIVTANDKDGRLELGPMGSDTSILPLPEEKLGLPGLQRMITKGLVEVGSFEDFQEAWDDTSSSDNTQTPLQDFQVTVESDRGRKDLVEKECLVTGKTVFQTMEEVKNDKPPLHESVAHLESQFVVQHTPKPDGGYDVTWARVTVGE